MNGGELSHNPNEVIIIGAGLAGLTIAKKLKGQTANISLLEKSRSAGGRVATRRTERAVFDHGAQFYKNSESNSIPWHRELVDAGLVKPWYSGSQETHFTSPGGMTQIAKYLARDTNVFFNEKVVRVLEGKDHLNILCESQRLFSSHTLILTPPLPQSLEILRRSQIEYPQKLEDLKYAKALVGLFEVSRSTQDANEVGYEENVTDALHSVSDQLLKGTSPTSAMTVVMTPEWSESHFERTEDEILQLITPLFGQWLRKKDPAATILSSQVKKWRYSHPLETFKESYVRVGIHQNIYLTGDAFGHSGSIRSAVRSAETLAEHLARGRA